MKSGSAREPFVYFASCPPGVEPVLLAEARELRLAGAEGQVGGVRFTGTAWDGCRAALHLRTAIRLYRQLAQFGAATADELYLGALSVDWGALLRADDTFAVDAKVTESSHSHSGFVALKVKDAVADWFRQRCGVRPSVDADRPGVLLSVHLFRDRCTLSLDVVGRSLHRRGYRVASAPAPLSETLAAAAVGLSGWDRKSPFLDPFCGSGTLLVEAGLAASGTAPGLFSDDFSFARRPGFDLGRWEETRAEAWKAVKLPRKLVIRGSDRDEAAVSAARRNIEAARLGELVRLTEADVRDFRPTKGWGATVISNPPYGVRLEEEEALVPLYEALARVLKERCQGFHVYLFVASGRLARAFKLKPSRYWPLKNGGLDVRLCRYEIR